MATTMGIQSLPNELLLLIVHNLALQPHETGYPVSLAVERNRSVLLALSKTTRKLALAANTILYETIIVTRPSSLVSLLRTVSQNSQVASHVKDIACLVTFNDADGDDEDGSNEQIMQAWHAASSHICNLAPDALRLFQLAGLASEETGSLCEELDAPGERVFAAIITLLPNLGTILFQPRHKPTVASTFWAPADPLAPAPYHIFDGILDQVLADQLLGPTVLQKLSAVKIQPQVDYAEPLGSVRCDACMALFKAPNLTIFDSYQEAGGWEALQHARGLLDVRLFGSLEPDTLGTVCDIPNLERLTLQPHMEEHTKADVHDDVFNAALAKSASTLKYLQFLTMANESLIPSYGPQKRLHCFSKFSRLEELDIEIFALMANTGNLDPENGLKLQNSLPSSLKTLILSERWTLRDPAGFRMEGDALELYHQNIGALLTSFAESCASGRMSAMRKFTFVRHSDLTEVRYEMNSPAIKKLKKLFAKAGWR